MRQLREFLESQRDEILARARLRVVARSAPASTDADLAKGLPAFLDQLDEALHRAASRQTVDHADIQASARQHGENLYRSGRSVAQVVHDYGDLCQVITELAVEQTSPISPDEFSALNLCLDDAIAGAVTEYSRQRERAIVDEGTERLGVAAHEMRNLLGTAMLSFASIKRGTVAPGGATGAVVERTLMGLQRLVERSLADVRLDAGIQNMERLAVWQLLEDVEVGATMLAQKREIQLSVGSIDPSIVVLADRQILAAALFNLLQNAFKFTPARGSVWLRASAKSTRVLIEVEDECGGLPPGKTEELLRPFEQRGHDRTGVGLGLSICFKAVKAMEGDLHIRDMPRKGCVFTIDLPRQPPPPTSIRARAAKPGGGGTGGARGTGHT
jgi:signal transduction histidine kinase